MAISRAFRTPVATRFSSPSNPTACVPSICPPFRPSPAASIQSLDGTRDVLVNSIDGSDASCVPEPRSAVSSSHQQRLAVRSSTSSPIISRKPTTSRALRVMLLRLRLRARPFPGNTANRVYAYSVITLSSAIVRRRMGVGIFSCDTRHISDLDELNGSQNPFLSRCVWARGERGHLGAYHHRCFNFLLLARI